MFLWIVAALEMTGFGCCSVAMAVASFVPADQLQEQLQENPAAAEITVEQLRAIMLPGAIVFLVLGFLPGVAYLILGFFVRQGKTIAINFALLLLITQIIVFGIMMLAAVAQALIAGNPVQFTSNLLILGTLLAMLVATMRWLLRARNFQSQVLGEQSDPWNESGP